MHKLAKQAAKANQQANKTYKEQKRAEKEREEAEKLGLELESIKDELNPHSKGCTNSKGCNYCVNVIDSLDCKHCDSSEFMVNCHHCEDCKCCINCDNLQGVIGYVNNRRVSFDVIMKTLLFEVGVNNADFCQKASAYKKLIELRDKPTKPPKWVTGDLSD